LTRHPLALAEGSQSGQEGIRLPQTAFHASGPGWGLVEVGEQGAVVGVGVQRPTEVANVNRAGAADLERQLELIVGVGGELLALH
jgi:hypothetical protein